MQTIDGVYLRDNPDIDGKIWIPDAYGDQIFPLNDDHSPISDLLDFIYDDGSGAPLTVTYDALRLSDPSCPSSLEWRVSLNGTPPGYLDDL